MTDFRTCRFALALATALGTVGGAAYASPIVPHRAVYDLELAEAAQGGAIQEMSGRMSIEWADACDGITMTQRFVAETFRLGGDSTVTDVTAGTWEAADASSYRFSIRTRVDGRLTDEVTGRAELNASGGRADFEAGDLDFLVLPTGTALPIQLTVQVIDAAKRGERLMFSTLFDGSGDSGLYDVTSVIDPAGRQVGGTAGDGLLDGVESWPVAMTLFDPASTDVNPDYAVEMRLYANGITTDLVLDYGSFKLRGTLRALEALAQPDCP